MTSIETSTVDPARMITRAGEGERLSFLGMDLIWKVTSEMSRGAHVVFAHDAPPVPSTYTRRRKQ